MLGQIGDLTIPRGGLSTHHLECRYACRAENPGQTPQPTLHIARAYRWHG